MRRAALILAALLLVAAPSLADIEDPSGDEDLCRGSLGGATVEGVRTPRVADGVVVPIADPAKGPFYLDARDLLSKEHRYSVWLYAESNGTERLQRGARRLLPGPLPIVEPLCVESIQPDTLVF